MKKQISLSEVDTLVQNTILEKGLKNHITEEQIEEIKKNVRTRLGMPGMGVFYMNPSHIPGINDAESNMVDAGGDFGGGGMEETINNVEDQEVVPVPAVDNAAISHETIVDDQSIDTAKKEGELEFKEKIIASKAEELQQKEEELSYRPTLPSFVEKAEPGQLFIYDRNQLSLGGESLSNTPYNCVGEPESKKSMHDLWINDGKVRAEVFQVEYKKLGELIFDPFNGASKFVEMTQPTPEDLPAEGVDAVQDAINSQYPTEPMIDSVSPVTDVTLPPNDDMGLAGANVQQAMEKAVEKILKQYFINNASI